MKYCNLEFMINWHGVWKEQKLNETKIKKNKIGTTEKSIENGKENKLLYLLSYDLWDLSNRKESN